MVKHHLPEGNWSPESQRDWDDFIVAATTSRTSKQYDPDQQSDFDITFEWEAFHEFVARLHIRGDGGSREMIVELLQKAGFMTGVAEDIAWAYVVARKSLQAYDSLRQAHFGDGSHA